MGCFPGATPPWTTPASALPPAVVAIALPPAPESAIAPSAIPDTTSRLLTDLTCASFVSDFSRVPFRKLVAVGPPSAAGDRTPCGGRPEAHLPARGGPRPGRGPARSRRSSVRNLESQDGRTLRP